MILNLLKKAGLAIVSLLVVAIILFWSDIKGLYYFLEESEQHASTLANLNEEQKLALECVICHGDKGDGTSSFYPKLAGLSANYIEKQLHEFRSNERVNLPMRSIANIFNDEEIRTLAEYFAKQTPSKTVHQGVSVDDIAKGELLVQKGACASCHGPDLKGQEGFPRIGGQSALYLQNQLKAFKSGTRIDKTGSMAGMVAQFNEQELAEIAAYLTSL